MSVKVSTGLAKHVAVTGSLKSAFDSGFIKVYGGAIPATADAAESGSPLWTISVNGSGTGITFDAVPSGISLAKPTAAVWSGPTSAGTATHYRLVGSNDTGAESTTDVRVQGTVGSVAGVDFYMVNPVLTTNAATDAKVLASYLLTLPLS